MSAVTPCLWFAREAEEAAAFYVDLVPDSRITHVQRNPIETPSGPPGSVLVVSFMLGGRPFLAMNGGMPMTYTHAVSFAIDCADQAEVDSLWDALSAGGEVEQCGWLRDRYGVSWQIVPTVLYRLLADPDPAVAARVMQAMFGMVKLDVAALEAAAKAED